MLAQHVFQSQSDAAEVAQELTANLKNSYSRIDASFV